MTGRFRGHRSVVRFRPPKPTWKWQLARPFLKTAYANIHFRNTKPLFVLGCMRSGSTLLSHILVSHPEIFGAGETHVVWRDHRAFHDVALETIRLRREFPAHRTYVLDKILHSHLTPDPGALTARKGAKFLVLLRKPEDNIASMSEMEPVRAAGGIEVACKEYLHRIEDLDRMLQGMDKPDCMLVRYEQLTADPQPVLKEIRGFLGLRSPLTAEYRSTRLTGRWGYGDGSANILAGKIVTNRRAPVEIEPDALRATQVMYDRLVETVTCLSR